MKIKFLPAGRGSGGGEGEVGQAGQLDGQGHRKVTGQEGPVLDRLEDQLFPKID